MHCRFDLFSWDAYRFHSERIKRLYVAMAVVGVVSLVCCLGVAPILSALGYPNEAVAMRASLVLGLGAEHLLMRTVDEHRQMRAVL
jgi:hypothetical protein